MGTLKYQIMGWPRILNQTKKLTRWQGLLIMSVITLLIFRP